uniref:Uncharacterized protein n=1 Tax=viral metagenome TaxID=1070528 RepID=A0A6C0EPK3_9ZZZZ
MRIEYIVQNESDPIFRKLKQYCYTMNIPFETLLHESFNEVHVYKDEKYYKTCYPNENLIQTIQLMYETFELEKLEYLAKKQIWDEKLKYLKRLFKNGSLKTDSHITKNST